MEYTNGHPMNTPARVKKALAKYGIIDEVVNARVRSAGGAAIELSSVYVDIEVTFVMVLLFEKAIGIERYF